MAHLVWPVLVLCLIAQPALLHLLALPVKLDMIFPHLASNVPQLISVMLVQVTAYLA